MNFCQIRPHTESQRKSQKQKWVTKLHLKVEDYCLWCWWLCFRQKIGLINAERKYYMKTLPVLIYRHPNGRCKYGSELSEHAFTSGMVLVKTLKKESGTEDAGANLVTTAMDVNQLVVMAKKELQRGGHQKLSKIVFLGLWSFHWNTKYWWRVIPKTFRQCKTVDCATEDCIPTTIIQAKSGFETCRISKLTAYFGISTLSSCRCKKN